MSFRARVRSFTVGQKLTLITALTSALAVGAGAVAAVVYDAVVFRAALQQSAEGVAEIIGINSAAALTFHDAAAAKETVSSLRERDTVLSAALYDADGQRLAYYAQPGQPAPPARARDATLASGTLAVARPVVLDGHRIGEVHMVVSLAPLYDRWWRTAQTSVVIFLATTGLAVLLASLLQRSIAEGLSRLSEATVRVSQDRDYTVRIASEPREDEIGRLTASFNTMLAEIEARDRALAEHRDTLEQQVAQRTAELQAAVLRAEQASRSKSEFLANMSHELRTPLNGVLGMTELVLETEVADHQRDYLETIRGSATTLLAIISDILDFSKIEAGKMQLDTTDIELEPYLEDIVRSVAVSAHQKSLELSYERHPETPAAIRADATRLRQVLMNLLGNAVKFTERGEIVLRVRPASARPDERRWLECSVQDTGIGIPPDRQGQVFDAFTQADGSTTRKYGGTGLGLTISARLVQAMGGRMGLDSEPGRGSTFRFSIPVEVVPVPMTTVVSDAVPLTGLRALVVDDNATNRLILRSMLDRLSAESVTVQSAAEALDALDATRTTNRPFGIVLLDYHMPDMDGLQFLAEARRRGLDVPSVLLLTSVDLPEIGLEGRTLGVRASLIKPVRRLDLINAMRAVLVDKAGVLPAAAARPSAPPTAPATGRRILLAEDNPVNQRMALHMLHKRGFRVDVVNDGRQAVEAWTRETFDLVLMDVQMPIMDGFAAVAAIRAAEAGTGRRTPIIALTAGAFVEDRDRCLAAGMDAYVTKPFTAARLCETIEKLLASTTQAA